MNNQQNISLAIGEKSVFEVFHRIFPRNKYFEGIVSRRQETKKLLDGLGISSEFTNFFGQEDSDTRRIFTNHYNSGIVSESLEGLIKKVDEVNEISSAIRKILEKPKEYTINELLSSINYLKKQGNDTLNNQIKDITTYILELIGDYELCFKAIQRKVNKRLKPFKDIVSLFPTSSNINLNNLDLYNLDEEELELLLAKKQGSNKVKISSEYSFDIYTPQTYLGEFWNITSDIEDLKHKQNCLGQLMDIVDKNILNILDIFNVLKNSKVVVNNLLYSDIEYSSQTSHLVAGFYGSAGREQDIYDELFKTILSGYSKGSDEYYNEFYNYLMENLGIIEQIPINLRKLLSVLQNVPFLKEYITVVLENIDILDPLFKKEEFIKGNPFFEMMKFEGHKKDFKSNCNVIELKKRYHAQCDAIYSIFNNLDNLESLIKIAFHIKSNEWKGVGLDENSDTQYQNGWHPGRQINSHEKDTTNKLSFKSINKNQVLNPSPSYTNLVAYSGPNTSGKTFTGLQRDFFIRVAMQSFGYAPFESGNLSELFDIIVYMDRATTNAKAGKSAYMEEISRLRSIFTQNLNKKILFYIDEPFSTTSPVDQSGMIALLVDYINSNGGKCIIATHNEVFLESQINNIETSLYYFPIKDGEKTRILTKGIGTSDFFEIARIEGFREDIITNAEKYVKGKLNIDLGKKVNFKYVQGEHNTLNNLFPNIGEGFNPLLGLYSRDSDFDLDNGIGDFKFDKNFENLDETIIKRLLAKMIFNAPTLSEEALQERQELFSKLVKNDKYSELTELISYLVEIENIFKEIDGDNSLESIFNLKPKETINQRLNPIKMYEKGIFTENKDKWLSDNISIEKITEIIKYIGFNKILFGENIPEKALNLMIELKKNREKLRLFEDMLSQNWKREEKTGKKYSGIEGFLNNILEKEEKVSFDTNTNNLIKVFCDYFFPGKSFENTTDMINSIKSYFENILTESVNISLILPEIKLNNPRLIQKSFLLRLFDNGGLLGNKDDSKEFYRTKRLHSITMGILDNARMKGNIAGVLLTLIQAKKDYEKLRDKIIGLNNPVIITILNELDITFQRLWNQEGIDMVSLKDEDKRVGKNHLGRGMEGKEIVGRKTVNFHKYLKFGDDNKVEGKGKFTTHLYQLSALCAFSAIIKHHGLNIYNISNTNELYLANAGNICENEKRDHKNSLKINIESEQGMILTGPNGSGKTYYPKEMIINVMLGLSTGFIYADKNSSIPRFQKVIYLDRVVEVDNGTSSGALELGYWSEVLQSIDDISGPILLFADEIFSTTSQKYQGAFMASIVKRLIEKGVYFMISNHHGEVTQWLIKNAGDRVLPYHFGFTITSEQKIIYHRNLLPGIKKSYAKEVANTMGLFDY